MRGKKTPMKVAKESNWQQLKPVIENDQCNLWETVAQGFPEKSSLTQYAIERILHRHGLDNADNWQENNQTYQIDSALLQEIETDLKGFFALSQKAQIEAALRKEYGYVLKKLTDVEYKVLLISPDKLVFGQQRHYNNLNPEWTKRYTDRLDAPISLPLGVVAPIDENTFKVIDGYHRLSSAVKKNLPLIPVIVATSR